MSINKNLLFSVTAMLCLSGGVVSCQDNLSENDHYKAPDWLKGNAYEVLQQEGNYTSFLRAVDLSDYKSTVAGKSIVTVMAPDDGAFSTYLNSKGYASVDDLYSKDPQHLNELVGYHLMYYAYDWSKMVNFRPNEGDGASDEQKEVNAGYYYKHRTRSISPIEEQRVKLTPNATSDTLIKVYHYERYLPVFSNKMFETKGIDAAYNYNYFFPNTAWNGITGGKGGFNVAGTAVLDEDNVVTDNGYLYHVSQVLAPLGTIYDELKNTSKYSQFLSLYDSYSTYVPAAEDINNSLGYIVYEHEHGDLPSIAREWYSSSWMVLEKNDMYGYNVFAPSNTAMDNFFETYWTKEGGYGSLEELDPLIIQYFLYQSFANSNLPVFPEEIKNGTVMTVYNTPVNLNPDEVTDRKICNNGVFYGMDKMEAPAIFSAVVGPAFKDTTYQCFLYSLDRSSVLLSLASNKSEFVALIPSNEQFANTDPAIRLYTTTSGKELQQYSSDAGAFVAMGSSALSNIVSIHYAQNIKELPMTGVKVVPTNIAYNYWFVKDGMITTNALFNEQLEPTYTGTPFVSLHKLTNNDKDWSNGSSYSYDAPAIFEAASGDGLGHRLSVCNDKNYPYYMFAQLLQKAGLVEGNALSSSIVFPDDRFFVFIPTNEAITAHLSEIPGTDKLTITDGTLSGTPSSTQKSLLANYLRSYFFGSTLNSFTEYPYLGSSCKGVFNTTGAHKLQVKDNGTTLLVNFEDGGESVPVNLTYDCLPFAFNDGGFHLIDGILQ
ncbi:MAG: fasciclin domain-containing protein [Prevotella sp.]